MKEDLNLKKSEFTKIIKTALEDIYGRFFVILLLFSTIISCDNRKELLEQEVYEGPLREIHNVNTLITDSGRAVVRIVAPKQLDFSNGDVEWPEGLHLDMFNKNMVIESTFDSNYAFKEKNKSIYKGEGNVVVRNLINKDELNTEVLYWDEKKEEYYTDKFVTIISEGDISTGTGLTANQDFSDYTILKPSGTITLDEEAP